MLTSTGKALIAALSDHLQCMSEKSKAYLMGYLECLAMEHNTEPKSQQNNKEPHTPN